MSSEVLNSPVPIVSCNIGISTDILAENGTFDALTFIRAGKGEPKPSERYRDKRGTWRTRPGCGDLILEGVCLDCRRPLMKRHSCKQKTCTDCVDAWVVKRTESSIDRLLCPASLKLHRGMRLGEFFVSRRGSGEVPCDIAEIQAEKRAAIEYLKSKGVVGGCIWPHYFRATKEAKRLAREANMATWDWIGQQENEWPWTYYSLHFHGFGWFKWMKEPESGEEFIYKLKTEKDGHVLDLQYNVAALRGMLRYVLDHTHVVTGHEQLSVVSWIGSCAYNKFKTDMPEEELPALEPKKCSVCSGEIMPWWPWRYTYGLDLLEGQIEPTEYDEAIINMMNGEPPPKEAEEWI